MAVNVNVKQIVDALAENENTEKLLALAKRQDLRKTAPARHDDEDSTAYG
ncbi:hypothetical protein CFter6_5186 [Collimonas fungivorans]|uniref:Uncharacterized protein n=1 Tax=Collimonas fungivorans TaxID=158899 RepID=A0A127PIW0_9BURK|nr:hypothetical protein CFter6_5186 [Collimonas fungivorans]